MELIPENLGGVVVFNLFNSCGANKLACGNCADFPVAVHNWLMGTPIRYVLLDLQDEKDICPTFLEEMIQLAKRLRIPFIFSGVMDKAKRILDAYDYGSRYPTFITPEDAIDWLDRNYPGVTQVSVSGLTFGTPIATSRPRFALGHEGESEGVEAVE